MEGQDVYRELEARIKTLLPATYQDCYEEVLPVSMGSAGLKYGEDGKVAWNEIWATFCDLAMAGGPPHKGTLLEPGAPAEIASEPERYQEAAVEICRGITLATELPAEPGPADGWVRVRCESAAMAGWLMRAIVMENVAARCQGEVLELPAGPAYRIAKEVKNVITSVAKTSHYWLDHMWTAQHREITALFARMAVDLPLLEPGTASEAEYQAAASHLEQTSGLPIAGSRPTGRPTGWIGVVCAGVPGAVRMMRALVANNVLARREDTTLFLPLNPLRDPGGKILAERLALAQRFTALQPED